MRIFREMLEKKWAEGKFVCVGLDSDLRKIPAEHVLNSKFLDDRQLVQEFNWSIVKATHDLVCAYKLNSAFYEQLGDVGARALCKTISFIRQLAPDVPVIYDAKRADIGNTNNGYATVAFDYLEADAITVHPYLGAEALGPFLGLKDKGIIVLCRTSNPGSDEFQNQLVLKNTSELVELFGGVLSRDYLGELGWKQFEGRIALPLYQYVAACVAKRWNTNGNCALVVGATYPLELRMVRKIVSDDVPILVPGVGFQQKGISLEQQVESVLFNGGNASGGGLIVNSSRGIIFASSGPDFAEAARAETLKLHNLINQYR